MFHFPTIRASSKPRAREFSDSMRQGSILQFTLFIDAFQKRIAAAEKYPTLNFFRTSLARRGLLYSIMSAHWSGQKLNLSAECESKGMDYSNALKTIREAKKAGYIDKKLRPSATLESEFREGVFEALKEPKLHHLSRSLIGSNMMGVLADEIEMAEIEDGKKP